MRSEAGNLIIRRDAMVRVQRIFPSMSPRELGERDPTINKETYTITAQVQPRLTAEQRKRRRAQLQRKIDQLRAVMKPFADPPRVKPSSLGYRPRNEKETQLLKEYRRLRINLLTLPQYYNDHASFHIEDDLDFGGGNGHLLDERPREECEATLIGIKRLFRSYADDGVAWGEQRHGLRLGLRLETPRTHFEHGDKVEFDLLIQNISGGPAEFTVFPSSPGVFSLHTKTSPRLKILHTVVRDVDLAKPETFPKKVALEPGETFVIDRMQKQNQGRILSAANDQGPTYVLRVPPAEVPEHEIGLPLTLGTGRYQIQAVRYTVIQKSREFSLDSGDLAFDVVTAEPDDSPAAPEPIPPKKVPPPKGHADPPGVDEAGAGISWGQEQQGLRLGLRIEGDKTRFRHGDDLAFELLLQNTTDKPKTVKFFEPNIAVLRKEEPPRCRLVVGRKLTSPAIRGLFSAFVREDERPSRYVLRPGEIRRIKLGKWKQEQFLGLHRFDREDLAHATASLAEAKANLSLWEAEVERVEPLWKQGGMLAKGLACLAELDLLALLETNGEAIDEYVCVHRPPAKSSEDFRCLAICRTKSLRTNVLNRLIVMVPEEISIACWWMPLAVHRLEKEWRAGRLDAASGRLLVGIYIHLVSAPKIRLVSDVKSVYLLPPDYVGRERLEALRALHDEMVAEPDLQGLLDGCARVTEDLTPCCRVDLRPFVGGENERQIVSGLLYNLKHASDHVFYWVNRLIDRQRDAEGEPRWRGKDNPINLIWALLEGFARHREGLWGESARDYPRNFDRLGEVLGVLKHWYFAMTHREKPVYLYHAVLLVVRRHEIDWFSEPAASMPSQEEVASVYQARLDGEPLELDSFVHDMHTGSSSADKHLRFALEGARVENEATPLRNERYRRAYQRLKQLLDAANHGGAVAVR